MEIVSRYFRFDVLLSGAILLFWMVIIFFFSSLPGSENYFEPTLLYYIERKGAHVVEYAVLMFLAVRFFRTLFPGENIKKFFFIAAIFSLLYGISDEFHQSFVLYREATIRDVLIDGIGILIAGYVVFLFSYVRRK